MRYILLSALIATVSTPAIAAGDVYVGIDGGAMNVRHQDYDSRIRGVDVGNAMTLDHHTGIDLGLNIGRSLGLLRPEFELAYKRASLDSAHMKPPYSGFATAANYPADGYSSVVSAMGNLYADFGPRDGTHAFVGAGGGIAWVRTNTRFPVQKASINGRDEALAYQLLAGAATPVTDRMSMGLKYRYFVGHGIDFVDSRGLDLEGDWNSHSLMASLIFNFAKPAPVAAPVVETPPPPPPPPPAPATQTCPDGTMILAIDSCPVPPPPPPPPAPEPERG